MLHTAERHSCLPLVRQRHHRVVLGHHPTPEVAASTSHRGAVRTGWAFGGARRRTENLVRLSHVQYPGGVGLQLADSDNNGDGPTEFGDDTHIYRTQYTGEAAETLSIAVIKAVAEWLGKPPTDLDPFYDELDPEILDHLYESKNVLESEEADEDEGFLTVTYSGCEVTVFWNGVIEVRAADTP